MKKSEFYAAMCIVIILCSLQTVFAVSYQVSVIQPTKPYRSFKQQSSTTNTWYTITDISGKGNLNYIALATAADLNNAFLEMKITIDGTDYSIANVGNSNMAAGFYQYNGADYTNHCALTFYGPLNFKTSLKVEFRNTNADTKTIHGVVDYATE